MLRRRSRIVQGLALAVTSVIALAGCGGGGASSSTDDAGSPTSGTVQWWSWTPDNDLAEREIAAFNQQYPDIKVVYKKVPISDYPALLRPALASDSGPDVFTLAASGSFSADVFGTYAADLTPRVKELLGDDWQTKVYENGVKAFTQDDELKAMPWAKVGAGNLWINADLFDKYGVKPPTTLAEWKSACKTFRDQGLGCLKEGVNNDNGFAMDTFHSIAESIQPGLFGQAVNDQAKWTDPAFVQAYQIFGDLEKDGILDAGAIGVQQYPDVNNAFLSGKVPMVQMGSWYAQYATVNSLTAALQGAGVPASTPKSTIVPIPFPDVAGKGNPATTFADPDAAQAVNAKSKVRGAATTFALWLGATKEGQQVVANNVDSIPTLAGVTPDWASIKLVDAKVQEPLLQDLVKKTADATATRSLGLTAVRSQAIFDTLQSVAGGKQSPAEAAATVQQTFDANPIEK